MKTYLWGIAVLSVLAASAAADDASDEQQSIFDQLDANSDGLVTSDEVSDEQERHFNRLLRRGDADENGELTRDEFIAATTEEEAPAQPSEEGAPRGEGRGRMAFTPEMAARLDANDDGVVTLEEIPEDLRPRFAMLFERLNVDEIEVSRLRELAERQQEMLASGDDEPRGEERPRGEGEERPDGDRPRGEGDEPREEGRDRDEGDRETDREEGDRDRDDGDRETDREEGDRDREEGDREEGDRDREQGDRDQPREGEERGEGDRPFGGDFRGPDFFRRLDENGDRRLSEQELEGLREIFGELDRNDDELLDVGELMGFPMDRVDGPDRGSDRPMGDDRRPDGDAPRPDGEGRGDFNPREFFSRIDADGNGFISEDEAPERLRPDFDAADTNDDGQISPEELMAHLGGQRGEGGDRPAPSFDEFFSNIDRNDDGFITEDEMPEGRAEEMLDRADADDDGKLSEDEVRTVFSDRTRPEGDRPDGDRPDGDRPEGDRPDRDRPETEEEGDRPDREREDDRPDAR